MTANLAGRGKVPRIKLFADYSSKFVKKDSHAKPKTINDIKRLQSFVQEKRTTPGQSLAESIKK